MPAPTKRCKIHYRRLRRNGSNLPPASLSELLTTALNYSFERVTLKDKVELRIAPSSAENPAQRVLNHLYITDDYIFGNACSFTPGQMQALLRTAAGHESQGTLQDVLDAYDIQEARARAGHEYIGGICYWLAIEDHFYQIQHVSLQAKQMEEYFNWLLRERTQTVGANAFVELMCEFDRNQVGGDLGEISAIEIGGIAPETVSQPIVDNPTTEIAKDVETTEAVGSKSAYFEKARKVLDVVAGPIGAKKILEEMPDEASLEVKVNIGYKATKRKFNKDFMGNIASGLRNLPDGEMRVRGKYGEMHGSDIRLSEDMSVKKLSEESSLLDLEHALEQMLEVHRRFVHDGRV